MTYRPIGPPQARRASLEHPSSPKTLGERLRWAVERQPTRGKERGLRLFQRRMEERAKEIRRAGHRAPDGTALSSIQGYLAGGVEPSLAFVEEAARVLRVRAAWLAFGSGMPTEDEQAGAEEAVERLRGAVQSVIEPGLAPLNALDLFLVSVRDTFADTVPGYWRLPDAARTALLIGFSRFIGLTSAAERHAAGEALVGHGAQYGQYLRAPFELGGVNPERLSPAELAMVFDGLLRAIDVAWYSEQQGEAGQAQTDSTTTGRT